MRRFLTLLVLELRFLGRQASFWWAFGPLTACLLVAAHLGAIRVKEDLNAITAAHAEEARIEATAKEATERFSRPSPLKVDFYRDPTGAYSYMTMFLVRHTIKPPTPLSALAIGQSDVQPNRIRLTFGFSAILTDDYVNIASPRMLKLGGFDVAFVFIYLMPLALIAISVTRLSAERESGILRMISAQPISMRMVAGAKFGAVALAFLAWLALAGTACLILGGVIPIAAGWSNSLASVVGAVAVYGLFWIAVCWIGVAMSAGVRTAVLCAIGIWLTATILLPAGVALAVELTAPSSSRVAYIDASRRAVDHFYEEGPTVAAQWAAQHPQLSDRPDLASGTEVTRLARDAYFRETLRPFREKFEQRQASMDVMASRLSFVSPAILLRGVLEEAAGADQQRQIRFLGDTDEFGQRVRAYFSPLIIQSIRNPPKKCEGCTAQLNFSDYDQVPEFTPLRNSPLSPASLLKLTLLISYTVAALAIALTMSKFKVAGRLDVSSPPVG